MLGVISSDGQNLLLYWFTARLKINTKIYLNILRKHVLPWVKARYPNGKYVFQQVSALAHKAKKVQKMCAANFAEFWPASIWPPSSPDLSPFDDMTWDNMEWVGCTCDAPWQRHWPQGRSQGCLNRITRRQRHKGICVLLPAHLAHASCWWPLWIMLHTRMRQ